MTNEVMISSSTNAVINSQSTDDQIIQMWLHGRGQHTQRAYKADVERFMSNINKTLQHITLRDVQAFADSLGHLAPATKARILSSVKSLFSFAHKDLGILQVNVSAPVQLPTPKNTLAERIMSEAEVHRMIALELNPRNHIILLLLYAAGLRVSEICGLKWRDTQEREDINSAQITVLGKGGKTRTILLSTNTWQELSALQEGASLDDPIFTSRKKAGHLDPSQIHRIVKEAAKRAGITRDVSPHWLRHAHASHALDRGAPIHLVQSTLGHSSVATTGRYLHARPTDSSARYLSV